MAASSQPTPQLTLKHFLLRYFLAKREGLPRRRGFHRRPEVHQHLPRGIQSRGRLPHLLQHKMHLPTWEFAWAYMNIAGGKLATRPNPYSKRWAPQGPRSLAYFKPFLTVGSFHQRGGNFLQKPAKLNISKTGHNHSADHGVGDDDGPARDERSKRMCSPTSCDAIAIQQFLPHQWDNLTYGHDN